MMIMNSRTLIDEATKPAPTIYPHLVGRNFGKSNKDAVVVVDQKTADKLFGMIPDGVSLDQFIRYQHRMLASGGVFGKLEKLAQEHDIDETAFAVVFGEHPSIKARLRQSKTQRLFEL